MNKKIVLAFIGFYLPGLNAGGPVKSLSNIVSHLDNDIDFYIVTRNHDLGDTTPYQIDGAPYEWTNVKSAKVMYVSKRPNISLILKIRDELKPDYYYFNSFFDANFSIYPFLLLRMIGVPSEKLIIASRGEFSESALFLKRKKKNIYLRFCNIFRIYNGVRFHASSTYEKEDISKTLICVDRIVVASDLPDARSPAIENAASKRNSSLSLVLIARISPMKNIDYALNVLKHVKRNINFAIYGPIEDEVYWRICKNLIDGLPINIDVTYYGALPNDLVPAELSRHDLLFLPSRGENYCHVIAESLSAGTRVLISDKTPWRNLQQQNFGWDLSLQDMNLFIKCLEDIELGDLESQLRTRTRVSKDFAALMLKSEALSDNKKLFQ